MCESPWPFRIAGVIRDISEPNVTGLPTRRIIFPKAGIFPRCLAFTNSIPTGTTVAPVRRTISPSPRRLFKRI